MISEIFGGDGATKDLRDFGSRDLCFRIGFSRD